MHALVYTQPNEVCLQDRPYPEIADGEVIIKIEAAGICGSDMHAYHGHDPRRKPGLVLGHEFAGSIVKSLDASLAEGDRVTGNPSIVCGTCDNCVQGRSHLCTQRGMVGMTRPGAFAEFMSIPAASLIKLPADLASDAAALTEPAATALHAINLAQRVMHRPLQEGRVLLIGGGAIGMLGALLLKHYGVDQLAVVELNAMRRQSIADHVGCEVIDTTQQTLAESTYDLVLDCVGAAATRKLAFSAVKAGGVILHVGLQDWASEIDMRKLTLGEITLMGTFTYTLADLRATVSALQRGVFGDLAWVERRSLADGPAAFSDLHQGKTAAAKVLLKPA
ncbi:MAG: alcohol dehydrogenase catalytic domain-containing protein [Rhodocyclaceae bacterium]|nr:alcohol dehydrogenase catalytic domain-containing protein [Rhodocyclaceae bacterium]